jgi:hypothetical protein
MERQLLNIGEYSFVCERIENSEFSNINSVSNFVMLRNFKLDNAAIIDNDIYIVEESLLDSSIFPIPNQVQEFTNDKSKFFQLSNENVYKFYDKNHLEKELKYDILRIYHPNTFVKNINIIIYVDILILGIHFHLYCRTWESHTTDSNKEFKINKSIYNEFIEIRIPNLADLFSKDTFIKENTNFPILSNNRYTDLIDDNNYMSTFLFTVPFAINGQNKVYKIDSLKDNELPFTKYPLNITLYPYSSIESSMYVQDEYLDANTDVYITSNNIDIQSVLGFSDDGHVIIGLNFIYPNPEDFSSVSNAYEYYNNFSVSEYEDIMYEESDEHNDIDKDGNMINKQYQCVYQLELASDASFKNIIYRSPLVENVTLFNSVQNMQFEIPIFNSWDQMPEILVARTIFSDRYLGFKLISNFVLITKEWYKYLVTYTDKKEIYRLKIEDMTDVQFNDKVTCVIRKTSNQDTSNNANTTVQNAKIIYKPVFYKVQDLQNIQIRKGVTQNIGINLNNYLTKVNTFYMNIDGQQFIESARNEIYVIFKIQANRLTAISGTYHISNQDNEYISSGNYTLI